MPRDYQVVSAAPARWLTARVQMRPGMAKRQVRLAHALAEYPSTGAALAAGTVSADHAEVITAALESLPVKVSAEQVLDAEQTLLGHAARFRIRQRQPYSLLSEAKALTEQAELRYQKR